MGFYLKKKLCNTVREILNIQVVIPVIANRKVNASIVTSKSKFISIRKYFIAIAVIANV